MKNLKRLNSLWFKKAPWIPIITLCIIIFASIFAGFFATHSPTDANLPDRLASPGTEGHILGTDRLGRDLYSRMLYGGRVSLLVAAVVLLVAGGIGLSVGVVAGYFGGKIDAILMRIVDIFLSFPPILIAIVFAVSFKPGVQTVILAISVCYWSRFCRVIRAEVLQFKEREYVALARVAGCSHLYIMVKHILPSILDTFMVIMSLEIGLVIRMEATLSFLGAGIAPPTPSWGQMVGAGREYLSTAWWISLVPGAALAAVIFSFNMIGDWIRDMMDPQLRAVLTAEIKKNRWWWLTGTSRLWGKTTPAKANRDV